MQKSKFKMQRAAGEEKCHPRLFFTAEELERLRGMRGYHEQILKNIRESAEGCLERPVRNEWIAPVTPDPNYGNLYDRFYAMMHDMAVMEHLAFAYAYLETDRYLKGAKEWTLACSRVWRREAKGEPDAGKAYAAMRLIKGLAVGYDLLYHRLTKDELGEIRDTMAAIGRKYFQWYLDNPGMAGPDQDKHHGTVEAASFGLVALALLEEIPEARSWLELMIQKHTEYLLPYALTTDGTQEQTSNFWASTLQYRILFLDALRRVTGRDLFKEFPDCLPGRIALAAVAGKHRPGWDLAGQSVVFGPSYGQLNYWSPVLLFLAREHRRPIYQHLAMWDETLGSIHKTRYFSPQNEQLLFAWGPYAYAWYDPTIEPGIEPDLPLSFSFRNPLPGYEEAQKGWITRDVNEVYMRSSYAADAIVAGMRRCFTEIHAGGRVVVLTPWDRLNAEGCRLDEMKVTEYDDHAAIECKGEEDSGFEKQTLELYRPDRLRFYRQTSQEMVWKHGKKWVYSITYDEGCADLLKYSLPVHRKYCVPGHIAFVGSQIGVPRNVPGSSYDGMMILSKDEFQMLGREGWGCSCHGMTHRTITPENAEYELLQSRLRMEKTLEIPVKMFCLPGDNSHHQVVKDYAVKYGYHSILTIYDRVNTDTTDLLSLGRCPLHTEYPPPFYSVYDPYKRIHQTIDLGGWLIDYCHCPMPDKPIHPTKDCTTQELEERFKTIRRIGGEDVWVAEPNEVVDYLLQKRK